MPLSDLTFYLPVGAFAIYLIITSVKGYYNERV